MVELPARGGGGGGGLITAIRSFWKNANTAVNFGVGISSTGQICLVPQLLKIITGGISPNVSVATRDFNVLVRKTVLVHLELVPVLAGVYSAQTYS
jgi:hypothetical protein